MVFVFGYSRRRAKATIGGTRCHGTPGGVMGMAGGAAFWD